MAIPGRTYARLVGPRENTATKQWLQVYGDCGESLDTLNTEHPQGALAP
jgi:hypothetical protein